MNIDNAMICKLLAENGAEEFEANRGYFSFLAWLQENTIDIDDEFTLGALRELSNDITSIISEEEKHIRILQRWAVYFSGIKPEQ